MPTKLWPRADVCQLCSPGDRVMDLCTWLHPWSCFLMNCFGSKGEVGRSRQVSETFVKHHRYFKLSIQWAGRQDKCSDRDWHMECMDVSVWDHWERHSLVWWEHNVRGHWWTVWLFFHSTNSYRTSTMDQAGTGLGAGDTDTCQIIIVCPDGAYIPVRVLIDEQTSKCIMWNGDYYHRKVL